MLGLNVNSITKPGRELELQHLLDDLRPAVVALSETEVPVEDNTIAFRGYTIFLPTPAPPTGRLRLLLLLRQDVASRYRAKVVRATALEVWLELHLPCGPTMVCAIYRQWSNSEEADLHVFHDNLREFSAKYGKILAIGDVNLDWGRRGDPKYYRRKLLQVHSDCLRELQLNVANELDPSPTYKSYAEFRDTEGNKAAKESILDHLYYVGMPPPRFQVLPHAATDHRPIMASFDLRASAGTLRRTSCRNFKALDASICLAINAEALSRVFQHDDVDTIHRIIVQETTAAMDMIIPEKTITVKERKIPLYLSPATLQAISDRDAAAAGGTNHSLYRKLRNRANRLLRRDKLQSNSDHLNAKGYDPKVLWNIANESTGRTRCGKLPPRMMDGCNLVEGDHKLAAHANSFYVNKIAGIRDKIDNAGTYDRSAPSPTTSSSSSSRFKFRPPSEAQVHRIIMGLNNTQALGTDGIPVAVLKALAPVLAAPLAHLIRKSLETSIVPDGFKLARVTPVHKGRGKALDDVASFRPIAILAAMSKVLERAVLQQLSPHLAPLLPNTQFGFRPKRSTTTAILAAQGSWAAARARGLAVGIAGYDMSAAFDTVDSDMLAKKLVALGVTGKENLWFRHYLRGRRQQVDYNGSLSPPLAVPFGVPQGSILGPVLFLVLVSDLPRAVVGSGDGGNSTSSSGGSNNSSSSSLEVGVSGYADDVAIWVAGKDPILIKERLEQISTSLIDYCGLNYLSINSCKTQILWSGCAAMPVEVGGVLVHPAGSFEFLGVTFDRQLSVTPYLENLVTTARSLVIMCRRLLQHLPPSLVKSIMQSMIRGKIGYACAVLPPRMCEQAPKNVLMNKIQVALNDVGRAIVGCRRSEKIKVEDILDESSIPSLNKIVIETIGIECWKALNIRDAPDLPLNPLGNLLTVNKVAVRKTRADTSNSLPPPTKIQSESFMWWAYTMWNSSLPLRSAPTLNAAKSAAVAVAATAPI